MKTFKACRATTHCLFCLR